MSKKNKSKNHKFGLIGEKLGHSFSPLLHAKFGDYDYALMEIAKDDIDDYFRRADFCGVNVTIPYKETAIQYCEADDNARSIGCVNTLVKTSDGVRGYNTDTFGFEYMLKRAGIDVAGKSVSILGSGGTCRTAAYTVSRLGASSVTVVSRNPSDMGLFVTCPVRYVSYDDEGYKECRVLINTTPVGMYPHISGMPVDINKSYVNLEAVADVIYNPLNTRLVYNAKRRALKATGGLPMLVAQGYFAAKLFKGRTLSADPVGDLSEKEISKLEKVIAQICAATGNIVLTGMPGSGKSTVGKIIAKKLDKEFVDTDELFSKDNGISPAKCIKNDGEPLFRALEKKIVEKAAQKGGRVIATGGGVILDPENIEMLSLNGTIVFINRELDRLATSDRPLSQGHENLKALYYKRLPIYLANCDHAVEVCGDARSVADDVIASLHNNGETSMKILVINGPNLNMLGIREPDIYGRETNDDLIRLCKKKAKELGVNVKFAQSNHEGELVDIIQRAYGTADAIVINPGAYTHTSVAILDALKTVALPTIEVHISDVDQREEFRQKSYIRPVVKEAIIGHGLAGYTEAMEKLAAKK